ncbi:MAG: hypothetical protein KC506_01565, partial [Nanoarchaeota archaeon]|nr:hypothetical protein [Nanoarchaeota archaeon]
LIVIGALLILNNQNVENPVSDIGGDLVRVLDEISQNVSLRIEIVSSLDEEALESELENFVVSKFGASVFNFDVEICKIDEPCFIDPYPDTESEIIAEERIIGASIREVEFSPKIVKIFAWRKS